MKFAVLTGDLVASTTLSARDIDAIMGDLDEAVNDAGMWRGSDAPVPVGFRRRGGDAWQAALAAPEQALRLALLLKAATRRRGKTFDTRIAIATGDGVLPNDGDTNAAHGPAFVASGRLLEAMSGPAHMADARGGWAHAAAILADHVARGWTQAQARSVTEMLPPNPGPRADAAQRLGVTRQAVDQALHAAAYPELIAALAAVEKDAS